VIRLFVYSLIYIFLAGCAFKSDIPIQDVQELPQDPMFYIKTYEEGLPQDERKFLTKYYQPWHWKQPPMSQDDAMWAHRVYHAQKKLYGENRRIIDKKWFDQMLYEANFNDFASLNGNALSKKPLNVRLFPTYKSVFKDFDQAGEGFPFDYMQNSTIHAFEPLFVSHLSRSKEWAYVSTAYVSGWVLRADISFISPFEQRSYQQAEHIYLLKDDQPLYDQDYNFVTRSKVGMVLPVISKNANFFQTPFMQVPKSIATTTLFQGSSQSIAKVATALFHTNYGWGGWYDNRDCSSTLRDIFTPFGIWLPRNSKAQSEIGTTVSLENLGDEEKIETIKINAVPFKTLLYKPGHVMLYLGIYQGEVIVYHNVWGVKTKLFGKEGRKIVGKTVITTLQPGRELIDYDPKNSLLRTISSMNILPFDVQ
jgi:hypothetical protein